MSLTFALHSTHFGSTSDCVCLYDISLINELHYRVLMYRYLTDVAKNVTWCRIDIVTLTIKLQMATSNISPPKLLNINDRSASSLWKSWRKTWTRFEVATGIDEAAEKKRVCTLLSGEDAVKVFET